MNLDRLKQAESAFLTNFPGGFNHPEMVAIGKKHKMTKMIELSKQVFSDKEFAHPNTLVENLIKVVSQSSMVSMFEKPKFREFCNALSGMEKDILVEGLHERLHGNEQRGFEMMLEILETRKMARWTLISICPTYFNPTAEVYVKPTTVKKIISQLELSELVYNPGPSWAFYEDFRDRINKMKTRVDESLSPSNAAFTGFLMMSL